MKKLIASVLVIVFLVSLSVCVRFYLKNCTADMRVSVERITEDPESQRGEFDLLFESFKSRQKTLSFFVHGEILSEIGEKMAELSKLYAENAETQTLRDGLIELSVAIEKMYFSYSVSVESVF